MATAERHVELDRWSAAGPRPVTPGPGPVGAGPAISTHRATSTYHPSTGPGMVATWPTANGPGPRPGPALPRGPELSEALDQTSEALAAHRLAQLRRRGLLQPEVF